MLSTIKNTTELAYIDPGSNYVLLQIFASFFVGALFYVKRAYRMIFNKKSKKNE